MNDDSAFCPACGARVSGNNNGQQFSYGGQQMGYGMRNGNIPNYQMSEEQHKETLIATFASKVRILGIVWLVIGILQVVFGLFYIGYSNFSLFILFIVGVSNIAWSVMRLNYANKFLNEKKGMTEYIRKTGIGSIIFMGIWNLLFGGVIGVLAAVYEIFVYNYGKEHEAEFWQVEQYMQNKSY
ncbi:MAG: hypothetical protein IJ583_05505 [Firmicutes bacterium]|nr:hypothetical protein [Bacillota bacterium]